MKIQTAVLFSLVGFALLPLTKMHAANQAAQLLGPTGLSGSITKDSIKVTHIAEGSPAAGKIEAGAVIVGIGGQKFEGDVRRMFAAAIDAAETPAAGGKLPLLLNGNQTLELQLEVLGSYSPIAPYNCPKTDLIIERAAEYLAHQIQTGLQTNKGRFDSGATHTALLGLMATGEKKYLSLVADAIKSLDILAPDTDLIEAQLAGERPMSYVGWYWGYHCILLGEYYMLTGDSSVLPALKTYAVSLAKGQDAGGLWGHRMAVDGRLPGYAQMNQSSLSSFMGMLMARKCGIDDPDLNQGIAKTYAYYATHIGRGGFNYGVHGPNSKNFNNNGMSGSAAMCMALLDDSEGVRFFSRMSATSYDNLEQGHASNFFNPLWTPLAASLSGPEVTHGFFMESLWYFTTSRTWDGSFQRNGKERGKEGSQTGLALLTYCLPRKALFITGKNQDPTLWLKGNAATEVLQMSQIDYPSKRVDELLALFDSPFPQVRVRAAWALRDRNPEFIPQVVRMLESGTPRQRESALQYFGYQCPPEQAHPQIARVGAILRNKKEDPELRAQAAAMLASHGEVAYDYYDDMLQLIVDDEPGDHFQEVNQSVGKSLKALCSTPYAAGLVKDKRLFYAAAQKLIDHKRQDARAAGINMLAEIPMEDFPIMAESIIKIIEDQDRTYHSYHAWQSTIGPAIEILSHLKIAEGLNYAGGIFDREGGKWGFKVRMFCAAIPNYGANAQAILAKVKEDKRLANIEDGRFRSMWQSMVKAIEEDPSPEQLITLEEALR